MMARLLTALGALVWAGGWLGVAVTASVSVWVLAAVYLPVLFVLSTGARHV
jgi:uncharacterized protein (DUF983 family)